MNVQQTVAPFILNTFNAYDKFLPEILKNLAALLIFFVSSNNLDVLSIFYYKKTYCNYRKVICRT